jgi:protein TonB
MVHQPNWLLRSLILVSVALHIVIGWQLARRYRSEQVSYLELTLTDVFKPSLRHIPRPRFTPPPPKPLQPVPMTVTPTLPTPEQQRPVPSASAVPLALDRRLSAPSGLDLPSLPQTDIRTWSAPAAAAPAPTAAPIKTDTAALTRNYLEAVRAKIERHKRYPESARKAKVQGRAQVSFRITAQGEVQGLTLVKGTGSETLDTAAVEAVKKAAPFTRPPLELFNGLPQVTLTILFELE